MKEHQTPSNREGTLAVRTSMAIDADHRAGLIRNRTTLLASIPEESLVVDDRCGLTPAQAVEGKLMHLLKNDSLPVSHLQLRGLTRGRCEA